MQYFGLVKITINLCLIMSIKPVNSSKSVDYRSSLKKCLLKILITNIINKIHFKNNACLYSNCLIHIKL